MIKTKLTIEFEVHTQFGPADAVKMMDILTRIPAIDSVKISKIESDWKPDESTFPENENLRMIQSIPLIIR